MILYNKYNSRKVAVDGIAFDSVREARRYKELKLMQQAGKISDLRLQVPFELVPALYEHSGEIYTKGKRKGQPKRGKCIEKAVIYKADFVYTENGCQIVEDAKGVPTKDYIIKRKLFKQIYGKEYEFREV
jgi:hypothetical protein